MDLAKLKVPCPSLRPVQVVFWQSQQCKVCLWRELQFGEGWLWWPAVNNPGPCDCGTQGGAYREAAELHRGFYQSFADAALRSPSGNETAWQLCSCWSGVLIFVPYRLYKTVHILFILDTVSWNLSTSPKIHSFNAGEVIIKKLDQKAPRQNQSLNNCRSVVTTVPFGILLWILFFILSFRLSCIHQERRNWTYHTRGVFYLCGHLFLF